ncbi:MAG: phosphoribosylglycinamide formyltransferase [Planctomycetes bacterium]|nr:phosphoribosylglycinamide formyltransferase [Planctomycetota bacterium]
MKSHRFRPLDRALSRTVRLAVLISGGGTTLRNLLQKIDAGQLDAQVPLVVASRDDCRGIQFAKGAKLRCDILVRKSFSDVRSFSDAIFSRCREMKIDLVVCGGFLSLIEIPEDYLGRVLNIHPSLIPAFCGKGMYGHHVHEAVIKRGVKVSGCTVHFVDNEYDHGPIVLQRVVPVEENDTPETLASRVFEIECEALPDAIRLFVSGNLEIDGACVRSVS